MEKQQEKWNKGKTKETDSRIAKASESRRKTYKKSLSKTAVLLMQGYTGSEISKIRGVVPYTVSLHRKELKEMGEQGVIDLITTTTDDKIVVPISRDYK